MVCAGILVLAAPAVAGQRVGVRFGASASRAAAAKVERWWTPARMRAAKPLDRPDPGLRALIEGPSLGAARATATASATIAPVPDATQPPFRSAGRVFTLAGRFAGFCSGTAINTPTRMLVLTAGHCIYDILPGHHKPSLTRKLVFVPAYTNGTAPFGEFAAGKAFITKPWAKKLNENYDLAAVQVTPNTAGLQVADAVGGGEAIALNQPRAQPAGYLMLGYPGGDEQMQMQACPAAFVGKVRFRGSHFAGPDSSALDCFMKPGSSGGPWLINSGAAVAGITTFGIRKDLLHTFGPYFAGKNVGFLVRGL